MNIIRLLIVVGIAGGGYTYWKEHHRNPARIQAAAEISASGFVSLPPVQGHNPRTVFVVAAKNCTREEAQRADFLAEDLSRKGIAVQRIDSVNFSFDGPPDNAAMARIDKIMRGPLPIVFYAGRAKSNPSLDDVVAEVRGGGG